MTASERPRHTAEGDAVKQGQHTTSVDSRTTLIAAEAELRAAGRHLEYAGVVDAEAERLARIVFRLAQRVAVDGGRLEAAS